MAVSNHSRAICHVSIGTNNLEQAKTFYTTLLKTLAIDVFCDYEHAIAFGKGYPEFWVQIPFDQQTATTGNGCHFAFVASNKQQVHDFYDTALALGAISNGEPGPRPQYGDPYYGCFVIDADGNKIEASHWDFELAKKLY